MGPISAQGLPQVAAMFTQLIFVILTINLVTNLAYWIYRSYRHRKASSFLQATVTDLGARNLAAAAVSFLLTLLICSGFKVLGAFPLDQPLPLPGEPAAPVVRYAFRSAVMIALCITGAVAISLTWLIAALYPRIKEQRQQPEIIW